MAVKIETCFYTYEIICHWRGQSAVRFCLSGRFHFPLTWIMFMLVFRETVPFPVNLQEHNETPKALVTLKLTTLHSLPIIDPPCCNSHTLFFLSPHSTVSCYFFFSSPRLLSINYLYGASPVRLDCVYCSRQAAAAALWFFLISSCDDRLFFQPHNGKVHSLPVSWSCSVVLLFLKATFP